MGFEFYFVTYGNDTDKDFAVHPRIHVLPRPRYVPGRLYVWLIPLIHGGVLRNVDIIKSHQIRGSLAAVIAKTVLNKPYISRCGYFASMFARDANPWERMEARLEESVALRSADLVCVPNQAHAAIAGEQYGVLSDKLKICPNWIDTVQFAPDPHIQKRPRRICFVGQLIDRKGPLLLLEAVKNIPDLEILIIGKGKQRPQVEQMVRDYHLNAQVLDFVPNERLPGYLNACAIYVLPTRLEGNPKTLLEAMACALPVVSTSAFGANEVFVDQVHGLKCSVGNVKMLREAIETLLDNPAAANEMGRRGRAHIIENFSVEKAVARELAIYAQLLKARI